MRAWKSKNVADIYVLESEENKKRISNRINQAIVQFSNKSKTENVTAAEKILEINSNAMMILL